MVPVGDAMMPMWSDALVVLLEFLCFAMPAGAEPSGLPAGGVPIIAQRLFSNQDSGIPEFRRDVIKDLAAWQSTWDRLTRPQARASALPSLDFGRSMVILAAMGTRGTGGHAIAIEGVYRAEGRLWVVVREMKPGPGCMTTQALTAPAHAIAVPRSDEPVTFVERTETRGCR